MGSLPQPPPRKRVLLEASCAYGGPIMLAPDEALAVKASASVGKTRVLLGATHPQACDYCRRIFAHGSTQCPSCGAPRRMVR